MLGQNQKVNFLLFISHTNTMQGYVDLARQFTSDQDDVTSLALTLLSRDKDAERKIDHAIDVKDLEKAVQIKELEMKFAAKECFYKRTLSILSQRYVFNYSPITRYHFKHFLYLNP